MRSRGPRARLGSKDSKSNGAQLRHVRLSGKERMIKRRCFRNTTLDEVLADEGAASAEKRPKAFRPAPRESDLFNARQAETASHIMDWIMSPGLQPPK